MDILAEHHNKRTPYGVLLFLIGVPKGIYYKPQLKILNNNFMFILVISSNEHKPKPQACYATCLLFMA